MQLSKLRASGWGWGRYFYNTMKLKCFYFYFVYAPIQNHRFKPIFWNNFVIISTILLINILHKNTLIQWNTKASTKKQGDAALLAIQFWKKLIGWRAKINVPQRAALPSTAAILSRWNHWGVRRCLHDKILPSIYGLAHWAQAKDAACPRQIRHLGQ